jgi:hypothetical protein
VPTLAEIYEEQAQECLRAADKTEVPKHRKILLQLAAAGRSDAEALQRGEELQPANPPKTKARRRGAEDTPRRNTG